MSITKTAKKSFSAVADMLSEKEAAVFRRGRNAKVSHVPRGSSQAEYHAATGLEALFGWLALNGQNARTEELFAAIVERLEL